MHPRIEEIVGYLDTTRANLANTVNDVPEAKRDERPAEDRWSVAEVLEHLTITEGRVAKLLEGLIGGAKAKGLGAEVETSSILDSLDHRRITDRSERRTAPEIVAPRSATNSATAWNQLQSTRDKLRGALLAGDGLALSELKFEHPALGLIDVYQWAIFVGAHEARHTEQIKEDN